MKIFVKRSGGLANIGPIQGELDTDRLPPELAEQVQRLITPDQLSRRADANPLMTDSQQISVGFRSGDDGAYRQFEIDEASSDPELFDVCNELVNQVVRDRLADRS